MRVPANISFKIVVLWSIGGIVGALAFGMVGTVFELIEEVRHPIPNALLLKADTDDILGAKIIPVVNEDGMEELATLYAYGTDEKVDSTPSSSVLEHAHKEGLAVRDEVASKRTSNLRTFETSLPDTYISEFISGSPQYHEDKTGAWWQITKFRMSVSRLKTNEQLTDIRNFVT